MALFNKQSQRRKRLFTINARIDAFITPNDKLLT